MGIDGLALSVLSQRALAGDFGLVNSLQVVRHGTLVFDEYSRGWGIHQVPTLQSVSKSVTSLLVGIAIGEGAIRSVDQPVSESLRRGSFENDAEAWRALTMILRGVILAVRASPRADSSR